MSILLSATSAVAQPSFEVASVKQGGPERPDGLIDINLGTINHDTVTLTNVTLSECIQYAYGLTNEIQISGPDWIRDRGVRFEIVAKAMPETPVAQLRLMLQALLQERFRLELHREPRKVTHFLLEAAKQGPKLAPSAGEGTSTRLFYGRGRLAYARLSMDRFTLLLSRQLKQPIFNRTGLSGVYDVELDWTPEDTPPGTDAPPGPDIFSALQQQLGLKLTPSKEPLEVLVVDRAEKIPISN